MCSSSIVISVRVVWFVWPIVLLTNAPTAATLPKNPPRGSFLLSSFPIHQTIHSSVRRFVR